jgi:precorrin-6B methylase 1
VFGDSLPPGYAAGHQPVTITPGMSAGNYFFKKTQWKINHAD